MRPARPPRYKDAVVSTVHILLSRDAGLEAYEVVAAFRHEADATKMRDELSNKPGGKEFSVVTSGASDAQSIHRI